MSAIQEDLVPSSSINHGVDEDDTSLKSLFYRGFQIYNKRFRDSLDDCGFPNNELSKKDQEVSLDELLQLFNRIAFFVEKLALFSPNEELEDINTSDLIFMMVPFLLAELSSHAEIKENRKKALENSLIYWKRFLSSMESLGLCSPLDLKRMNRNQHELINPAGRREEKLMAHAQQKELEEKIKSLVYKKQKLGFDPYQWGSEQLDEELERYLIFLILKRSVNESLNHIGLVEQEIEFLSLDHGTIKTSTQPPKKPFIMTIKDPSELRKLYLEKVFQPFHELPTITLAEVAAWEVDVEVGQLGAEERKRQQERKKNKQGEGDEGNPEDATTSEDDQIDEDKEKSTRDWDDWKDENPKGIGNKKRNVG